LFAEGKSTVIEETKTRDHTENMLEAFGADIEVNGNEVSISHKGTLEARNIHVPGDISSAASLMVAAAIVPGSELTLKNVGLNESRSGIIDVVVNMGANIKISGEKTLAGEKSGDITISHKQL